MNLQQVNYVIAVTETGSYTAAAEKCFVTQSTLSTMISRFEEEIGIRVFDRKTKPVSLTNEGRQVIGQLKRISGEVQVLEELVQTLKGEMSGHLKIGIIPTVAPYILPQFLNDFVKKFPKITFSISEMVTANITEMLQKRELDIGILAGPFESDDLHEIPLFNEPFVLYDGSGSQTRKYASLDQLDLNNFWLLEEGHCLHTQVKRICDLDRCQNKENINFDFRAGSVDSLIRFVKMNQGITLLPYLATLDFSKREAEKVSPLPSPTPVRTISLMVHKHFVKKQILDLLKSEIQRKILPHLNHRAGKEKVVLPV